MRYDHTGMTAHIKSFSASVAAAWLVGLAVMLLSCTISPKGACARSQKYRIVIESADYLKYEKNMSVTFMKGNVVIAYEGTRIMADEAVLNERTKMVTAKGNVAVIESDNELDGEFLIYKYDEKYFELSQVSGRTISDNKGTEVFFTGETVKGTERKVKVRYPDFTTCGPHCPSEYHMRARDVSIFPNNKIIARKVAIYLRKTRVMWLPLYIISLKDEDRYMPEFGYDKTRGFYVLSKYPYLARELVSGWIILNYMTKKGTEYGMDHKYTARRIGGAGRTTFKTNNDKQSGNTNSTISLTQQLKFGKKFSGNTSYSRVNTYNIYTPAYRTNTARYALNMNIRQTSYKNLGIKYNFNESKSRSESKNSSIGLTRKTRFSKNLTLDYNYTQTFRQIGEYPKNEESTFNSTTRYNLPGILSMTMTTYKTFDPDGDKYANDRNVSVNNQKTPEINVQLQPKLWQKTLPQKYIPLKKVSFQHGRYRQGTRRSSEALRRNAFELMADRQFKFGNRLTITPRETYKQRFYNTKDAMYILDHTTALQYRTRSRNGKTKTFTMNYRKSGDSGGIPYPRDRGSEQIMLNGNFTIQNPKTVFKMATSYNYRTFSYSPLTLNYKRGITQNSTFNINGGRDLNRHTWNNTSTTLGLKRRNTRININATWDTEKDFELRNMNIKTEHKRRNGWKFQTRSVYEDNDRYSLLRDVIATKTRCCTQLQFSYNTERDEFKFQYMILAFPSKSFGFTQGGQGFEFNENLTEFKSEEQK